MHYLIIKQLQKILLFHNKLDCLVIRKIRICVTNALAYYCKLTEKNSFIGLSQGLHHNKEKRLKIKRHLV